MNLKLKSAVKSVAETLHRVLFGYMERVGMLLRAAHTAVASYTDAIYAISATLPATYDADGYVDTGMTYTVIGKVASFLPYGATRPINEWVPIRGAVEYMKGSPRYGQGDMVMGDVPADPGQVILKAAEASASHYSLKITYPDGEIHYLDVIVAAWTLSGGSEGTPMERTCTLGICLAPVVVAAPA